jgi:hypothetical protein
MIVPVFPTAMHALVEAQLMPLSGCVTFDV